LIDENYATDLLHFKISEYLRKLEALTNSTADTYHPIEERGANESFAAWKERKKR